VENQKRAHIMPTFHATSYIQLCFNLEPKDVDTSKGFNSGMVH